MAKFLVDWCEVKKTGETNGRPWKIINMTLKDDEGTLINDVSTFDPVTPGLTIEGVIEMKGQYKNFKSTPTAPKSSFKSNQMAVVEKVQEGVKTAQNNKELGIKISSTMRMAVDLAIAERDATHLTMVESILGWRKWLWNEWDKNETDFPPF